MKKTIIIAITIGIIFLFACSKKHTPEAPTNFDASATPNITQTEIALYTHTITPTHTVLPTTTSTPTITNTATITQTVTVISTTTETPTTTATPTITATSTVTLTYTSTIAPTPIPYSDIVSVPGGTFTQSDGTNSFSHTISTFKMGKYQVTYDLWYTVYTWAVANGYTFQNTGAEGSNGTAGAAPTAAKYQPVTTVNWRDVIVWCNAYSQKSALTPVYCSDAGITTPIKDSTDGAFAWNVNIMPGSFDNPYVNWSANGYRLPTEGEWQYVASYKDGISWTPYNYASGATADYSDTTATGLVAWYSANCSSTQAVGGKTANALGIYDMSGNVYEWCWDWYGTYPGTSTDYRGFASASSANRMMRGGSFNGLVNYLQVGYRYFYYTFYAYGDIGFRFARSN